MALLKFAPAKEFASLRVKIDRKVHDRVESYRKFCGVLELADLVKRALVYVMDRDAEFRARENASATSDEKADRRRRAKRGSPADKTGGALYEFLSHLMHFCEEPKNVITPTA